MTRKHLNLITEHDNEEWVGNVEFTDHQLSSVLKNEESPMQTFDEEAGTFDTVGKRVGLGYVDFDGEPTNDEAFDAIHQKLSEVDSEWLDKAGMDADITQQTEGQNVD